MRLLAILNRLNEECPSLNGRVEFVNSLLAPTEEEIDSALPMAWLSYIAEQGQENKRLKDMSQMVWHRFGIIIAAASSDQYSEPIADIRAEIKAALLGYRIDLKHTPVQMVAGDIYDVSYRVTWWQDVYEFGYIQSKN